MVKLGYTVARIAEEKAEYNDTMMKSIVGIKKIWTLIAISNWNSGAKINVPVADEDATSLRLVMKDEATGFEATTFCSVKPGATQNEFLDAFGTKDYPLWLNKKIPATYLAKSASSRNAEFSFAKYYKGVA